MSREEAAALARRIGAEEGATIRLLAVVLWSVTTADVVFAAYFAYNLFRGNPGLGRFPSQDELAVILATGLMLASALICLLGWSLARARKRTLDAIAEILSATIALGSMAFSASLVTALLVAETRGFGWRSSIALGVVLLSALVLFFVRALRPRVKGSRSTAKEHAHRGSQ